MELSWSTFLLEIINFLILVWILKRFLYKPVLAVIAKRRAGIEEGLQQAQQLQEQAHELKARYEDRMSDWDRERQQARDNLAREMEAEKVRLTVQLQDNLQQERDKARIVDERRRIEATREIEHQALLHSTQFASRLLTHAAGPDLQSRLLDLILKDISTLTEEQITAIRTTWGDAPDSIDIVSAYPLTTEQQQQLQQVLTAVTELTVPINYTENMELVAGLQITIGAWVMHLNIRDELKGFAEFAHATRR